MLVLSLFLLTLTDAHCDGDTSDVATATQTASLKWTLEYPGTLKRIYFAEGAEKLIVHHFEDGNRAKPVFHVISSHGKEEFQGGGFLGAISSDARYLIGSFGVKDLRTGDMLTRQNLAWHAEQKVVVSPSGRLFALLPHYGYGGKPYEPFLKIVDLKGNLVADLSAKVADLTKQDLLNSDYHAAFASEETLAINLRSRKTGRLLLVDINTGKTLWDVPVPAHAGTSPNLFASEHRVFIQVNEDEYRDGKWDMKTALCSYSVLGAKEWCLRRNYQSGYLTSRNGGYILSTILNFVWNDGEAPAISKSRSQLVDAEKGAPVWEGPYLGEPICVSEPEGMMLTLSKDRVSFTAIGERGGYTLALPTDVLRETQSARRSSPFLHYVATRKLLIIVKGSKVFGVGLAKTK